MCVHTCMYACVNVILLGFSQQLVDLYEEKGIEKHIYKVQPIEKIQKQIYFKIFSSPCYYHLNFQNVEFSYCQLCCKTNTKQFQNVLMWSAMIHTEKAGKECFPLFSAVRVHFPGPALHHVGSLVLNPKGSFSKDTNQA